MRETLVGKDMIIDENCKAVMIDRGVVNIDEPLDLNFAEFPLGRK
jgi:hypothetical protein